MFWTRAILWKIIKVLGYLIGMVRYYPARKKKYFFCPILDTSTCVPAYFCHQSNRGRDAAAGIKNDFRTQFSCYDNGFI